MTDIDRVRNSHTTSKNLLTIGFNRLVNTQYWRMMGEQVMPRVIPFAAALAISSGSLLGGALAGLPPYGKAAGLLLLGAATLATGIRMLGTKLPSRLDAARRIDTVSPTEHQVAENIFNTLKHPQDNPVWRLHIERLMRDVPKLAAEESRIREVTRKMVVPLLLPAALILSAGLYAGYGSYSDNLKNSFDMSTPVPPPVPASLNAWITQPGYTGEYAPIMLHNREEGGKEVALQPVRVIEGSILTIQLFDNETEISVAFANNTGAMADIADMMTVRTRGATKEVSFVLTEDMSVAITRGNWSGIEWILDVAEDHAPIVTLEEVGNEGRSQPRYRITIEDDYGATITDGAATIRLPEHINTGTPLPQYRDRRIDLRL